MRPKFFASLFWVLLFLSLSGPEALAQKNVSPAPPFEGWLQELKTEAQGRGISSQTINRALGKVKRIPRVLELDRRQPEFTQTFWTYMGKAVNDARIKKGKALLVKHKKLLGKIYKKYGEIANFFDTWDLETQLFMIDMRKFLTK